MDKFKEFLKALIANDKVKLAAKGLLMAVVGFAASHFGLLGVLGL